MPPIARRLRQWPSRYPAASGYLFLALAVGHIILISAQVNTRSGVPVLQAFVFGVFAEVQRGTAAVVGGVRRTWDGYVALQDVHADNLALKQQIARAAGGAAARARRWRREAESLRRLLDLRDRSQMPTRAAEVIGTSPTADFRTRHHRPRHARRRARPTWRSSRRPARSGASSMPSRHAAKVQLLIDRNAAVARDGGARRARRAIAMGTGESLLRLEYVSGSASIQTGDAVVTSGIDGIYPEGFVVGRVEQIERAGGLFRSVRVRPAVDFSALEHVLVVTAPAFVGPRGPTSASPTPPQASAAAPSSRLAEKRR